MKNKILTLILLLFTTLLGAQEKAKEADTQFEDDLVRCVEEEVKALAAEPQQGNDLFSLLESRSLASTEGLLETLVGGHVSAVTGAFVHHCVDYVSPGPERLEVSRTYNSADLSRDDYLKKGWTLSDPAQGTFRVNNLKKPYTFDLSLTLPTGSAVTYRSPHFKDTKKMSTPFEMKFNLRFGFTNCATGVLSAMTNPKNNQIVVKKSNKNEIQKVCLKTGSGIEQTFKKASRGEILQIHSSLHPSLVKKEYLYSDVLEKSYLAPQSKVRQVLLKHRLDDSKLYNTLYFDYFTNALYITAQNGRQVHYTFDDENLKYAVNSDHVLETYHYWNSQSDYANYFQGRMCRIDRPDYRCLAVDYYHVGLNQAGYQTVNITDDRDLRLGRVAQIKAPVGHDATPLPVYSFIHEPTSHARGLTTVFDIYNRKSVYHYKDERLTKLERCIGNHPALTENFYWGKKDSADEGNLIGKTWQDGSFRYVKGCFFVYDNRGNVIEETLHGNLTGMGCPDLVMNGHSPIPNGVEGYQKRYVYSQDGLNLLLKESEGNGRQIVYEYFPQTNALTKKLVLDGSGKIHAREFRFYDVNLFLTCIIRDDGEADQADNLSGVMVRKITRMTPRLSFPVGYPDSVSESYWDSATGTEKPLQHIVYHYNAEGRVSSEDHYDTTGHLRYCQAWEYDLAGNVIREMNGLGQCVTRQYDANHNKIFEQGPSVEFHTSYTYDFSNRLIHEQEIHADGRVYNVHHRYDLRGNRVATIDQNGLEITYGYDELDQLVSTQFPPMNDGTWNVSQPKEQYVYDALGNKAVHIDAKGGVTQTAYTAYNKPCFKTYADQTIEKWIYNLDGTLFRAYDAVGAYTEYARDCFGRVLLETIFSPEGQALTQTAFRYKGFNLVWQRGPEDLETTYQYDGAGRLTEERSGDQKTTYAYDPLGRLSHVYRWLTKDQAQVNVKVYDVLNRVIEERLENLQGEVYSRHQYAYDVQGNRTLCQRGDQRVQIAYNTRSQPICITDGEGRSTYIAYEDLVGGELALKVTSTDPKGNVKVELKDFWDRTRCIEYFDAWGKLLAKNVLAYDFAGNVTFSRDCKVIDGQVVAEADRVCEYNATSQLTKLTEAAGTPEQRVTRYVYNHLGQKSVVIKPNGVQLLSFYDGKGRLSQYTATDGSFSYTYLYNRIDQVLQVQNGSEKVIRSYDAYARLISETQANGLTITYAYDNLNRPVKIGLPDGTAIEKTYNAGHLKQVKRGKYIHAYEEFDLTGAVVKTKLIGNAGEEKTHYDLIGRPRRLIHAKRQEHLKELDPLGNLLTLEVKDPLGSYTTQYAYDQLNQVVSETGLEAHTYQYDSLHNRLSEDGKVCQFNRLNQILSQGATTFTYDLNGNLVCKVEDGKTTTYTYDGIDRLIAFTKEGVTTRYTYDAFNRRQSKNDRLFFYDQSSEIGCMEKGKICELRVLGLGKGAEIAAAVMIELQGECFAPLHDHNGNVVLLIRPDGQVAQTMRYTAFGKDVVGGKKVANPWGFASKRLDEESGLIYFGERYYDSGLGRWITMDPIGYQDGPNLYAYLHNNPLTHIDLFGLYDSSEYLIEEYEGPAQYDEHGNSRYQGTTPEERHPGADRLTQDVHFETRHPRYNEESKIYKCTKKNGIENTESTIITELGILSDFDSNCAAAIEAAERSNYRTTFFIVNQSHGFWRDFVECIKGLFGIMTAPAMKLRDLCGHLIEECGYSKININVHSQACIHTNNALTDLSTKYKDNIYVLALCPGGYISDKVCKKVYHYRALCWRDFVPYLDFFNAIREKNVVTLASAKGTSIHDHAFMSATYTEVKEQRFKNIREQGHF